MALEEIIEEMAFVDDAGRHHDVVLVQEYAPDGLGGWIEGMRRIELTDGSRLQRINDDTYVIICSRTTIRRA